MPIFKSDAFAPDDWRNLAQGEDLPLDGKVILTLPQWQDIKLQAQTANVPLGLFVEPATAAQIIAPELPRFALIVVAFPKFTDGRGYSLAHQFRRNHGFAGELRATGDILFDQLQLLARCGFDSFDISDVATIRLLEAGRRPGLGIFYQPGFGHEVKEQTRPWARRAIS